MKKPKVYTLEIPLTPPSINVYQHWHWAKKRKVKAEWTEMIWALLNEKGNVCPSRLSHVNVETVITFAIGRRRDAQNYGAVLYKFLGDALTASGIIKDDTSDYIRYAEPTLEHGSRAGTKITLHYGGDEDGA